MTHHMGSTPDEQAMAAFGAEMFDRLFSEFCDGTWEVEINDLITRHAVDFGLVERTAYDPEIHDSNDECEPGDDCQRP